MSDRLIVAGSMPETEARALEAHRDSSMRALLEPLGGSHPRVTVIREMRLESVSLIRGEGGEPMIGVRGHVLRMHPSSLVRNTGIAIQVMRSGEWPAQGNVYPPTDEESTADELAPLELVRAPDLNVNLSFDDGGLSDRLSFYIAPQNRSMRLGAIPPRVSRFCAFRRRVSAEWFRMEPCNRVGFVCIAAALLVLALVAVDAHSFAASLFAR